MEKGYVRIGCGKPVEVDSLCTSPRVAVSHHGLRSPAPGVSDFSRTPKPVVSFLVAENTHQKETRLSSPICPAISQVACQQVFPHVVDRAHAKVPERFVHCEGEADLARCREAERSAAQKEVAELRSNLAGRDQLVKSLQLSLVEAETKLRSPCKAVQNTCEEAHRRDALFVEMKSHLVSHTTNFLQVLKDILDRLRVSYTGPPEGYMKLVENGRLSIEQGLYATQGFLKAIQCLTVEMFSTTCEDTVVQDLLRQVAFYEQRYSQYAAENRSLLEELKSAEQKIADQIGQIFDLESSNSRMKISLQQSGQELLQLRAYVGRTEIASGQLEVSVSLLTEENKFLKAQHQQLLRASRDAKSEEVARLQQELTRMMVTLREAQLKANEESLANEKLQHERDQYREECYVLREDLESVRSTADVELAQRAEESKSLNLQLETATANLLSLKNHYERASDDLESVLDQSRQFQDKLRADFNAELSRINTSSQKRVAELQSEVSALSEQLRLSKESLSVQASEKERLSKELREAVSSATEMESLKLRSATLAETLQSREQTIAELRNGNRQLSEALQQAQSLRGQHDSTLERQMQEYQTTVSKLQATLENQIGNLQREAREASEKAGIAESALRHAEKELEQLRGEVSRSQSGFYAVQFQRESLHAENAQLSTKISELTDELQRRVEGQMELIELRQRFADSERDLRAAVSARETATTELDFLRRSGESTARALRDSVSELETQLEQSEAESERKARLLKAVEDQVGRLQKEVLLLTSRLQHSAGEPELSPDLQKVLYDSQVAADVMQRHVEDFEADLCWRLDELVLASANHTALQGPPSPLSSRTLKTLLGFHASELEERLQIIVSYLEALEDLRLLCKNDSAPPPVMGFEVSAPSQQPDIVQVHHVAGGGPAELAGLRVGDVVTLVGVSRWGSVSCLSDFQQLLARVAPPDRVALHVLRGHEYLVVELDPFPALQVSTSMHTSCFSEGSMESSARARSRGTGGYRGTSRSPRRAPQVPSGPSDYPTPNYPTSPSAVMQITGTPVRPTSMICDQGSPEATGAEAGPPSSDMTWCTPVVAYVCKSAQGERWYLSN
eukprot:RCo023568